MGGLTAEAREKLYRSAYDLGFEFEKTYYGCVQAVLFPFRELFGIHESVIKAATSLSGGIARTARGPCATFTGGILVFGYYFGRGVDEFENRERSLKTGQLTLQLRERFIQEYGGYLCNEVQEKKFGRSYNLLDPEDYQAFQDDGAYTEKCPDVVGKAATWILDILLKEPDFLKQIEK